MKKILHIKFTKLTFDRIKTLAPPGQIGTEVWINVYTSPIILELLFLPGKAKNFHLILEVKKCDPHRPGTSSVALSESGRAVGPLNDRRRSEVVLSQKLRDEPGNEPNDVTAFRGLRNANKVKVRASASILQVINFVHQPELRPSIPSGSWKMPGGRRQEIQNLADCNTSQGFYDAIKALYGPRKQTTAPVQSADGNALLKDRFEILGH
ncbi:hypothetical protein LDENG_00239360 [Lucifuga dentata]|nr:hypothetical protein LDENG_00239360 [Lucifuga dentata]